MELYSAMQFIVHMHSSLWATAPDGTMTEIYVSLEILGFLCCCL